MLRHVVVFTWKPEADTGAVSAFVEGLAALPGQIPDIRSYRFGADLCLSGSNDDFALVADFDDVDAYRRYVEHPAHRRLITDLLHPVLATRHAVQLEG